MRRGGRSTPPPIDGRRIGEQIAKVSAAQGIDLTPATIDRLACHLALLLTWNRRFSLTAVTDIPAAVHRHVFESLAATRVLTAGPDDLLVDLGSGNGYPALPLLTAWAAARGELVESRETKAAFLRAAIRETGLGSRVSVRRERLPEPAAIRDDATIVTLRAFPEPARWIAGALARPQVRAVLAWLSGDDARAIAGALGAARSVELLALETGALLVAR